MPAHFYPVILAGGRGTRFWPLSRKKRAKQLLALDGKQTMIQQTVTRLLQLATAKQIWVITNRDLQPEILRQLPKLHYGRLEVMVMLDGPSAADVPAWEREFQ